MKNKKEMQAEHLQAEKEFLWGGFKSFLEHTDLTALQIQNEYGFIVAKRVEGGKSVIEIKGFSINDKNEPNEDEDDEDGKDEEDKNEYEVKWL